MGWQQDIQEQIQILCASVTSGYTAARTKLTASRVSETRMTLSYKTVGNTFSVSIDLVEAPTGDHCLSVKTLSGEGSLLDSVVETFDGLMMAA